MSLRVPKAFIDPFGLSHTDGTKNGPHAIYPHFGSGIFIHAMHLLFKQGLYANNLGFQVRTFATQKYELA